MNYTKPRVICSFILCFIVFTIASTAVRLGLYFLVYAFKDSFLFHIFSQMLFFNEFAIESLAHVVGFFVSYHLLCALIPGAYSQQDRCIFVFGILIIILGILNFFPTFLEGYDKSTRVAGLVEIIAGIGLFRLKKQ